MRHNSSAGPAGLHAMGQAGQRAGAGSHARPLVYSNDTSVPYQQTAGVQGLHVPLGANAGMALSMLLKFMVGFVTFDKPSAP